MIVEITPRWRKGMAAAGDDWSTKALKSALKGHTVEFTGWMFRDDEHTQNSFNINPTKLGKRCGKAPCLWRATVWELHPVTAIKVIQ